MLHHLHYSSFCIFNVHYGLKIVCIWNRILIKDALNRLWWWNKIFRLLVRMSLLAELIRLVMMLLCVLVRLLEWPLSRVLLQPRPYSALTALPFSNFYIIHAHSICAWNIKNALWGRILSFKRACFVCSLISVTASVHLRRFPPMFARFFESSGDHKLVPADRAASLYADYKPSRTPHQNAKWCKIL